MIVVRGRLCDCVARVPCHALWVCVRVRVYVRAALQLVVSRDDVAGKRVARAWLSTAVSAVLRLKASCLHSIGIALEACAERGGATHSTVVALLIAC